MLWLSYTILHLRVNFFPLFVCIVDVTFRLSVTRFLSAALLLIKLKKPMYLHVNVCTKWTCSVFSVLQHNHSLPFWIDFPTQFKNEIQCNSHVLYFPSCLVSFAYNENKTDNNNNNEIHLHEPNCLKLTKECINLAFLVGAVDYEHRAVYFNLLPVCKLGKCRRIHNDRYTTHTHTQHEIQATIAFAFDFFPIYKIFVALYFCFALCRDPSTKNRHNTSHRCQPIKREEKEKL